MDWIRRFGRPLTLEAIRSVLDEVRQQFTADQQVPVENNLELRIEDVLRRWTAPTLLPVINASGVILHTNLGRAPLSPSALQATWQVAQGYSTLEYDLEKGKRGSRLIHAESLL